MYIIDTCVIISRAINGLEETVFTVKEVIDEAKDSLSNIIVNSLIDSEKITVLEPSENSIKKVRTLSEKNNLNLSDTDVKVSALALDYKKKSVLLTDDYSIQNIASMLGIMYSEVNQEGIKNILEFKFRCTGCKKVFDKAIEVCDDCGSELKRVAINIEP